MTSDNSNEKDMRRAGMSTEARRVFIDKIFERAKSSGYPVDSNPLFRAWVGEWIAGKIEIAELRRRYNELRAESIAANRRGRETPRR